MKVGFALNVDGLLGAEGAVTNRLEAGAAFVGAPKAKGEFADVGVEVLLKPNVLAELGREASVPFGAPNEKGVVPEVVAEGKPNDGFGGSAGLGVVSTLLPKGADEGLPKANAGEVVDGEPPPKRVLFVEGVLPNEKFKVGLGKSLV